MGARHGWWLGGLLLVVAGAYVLGSGSRAPEPAPVPPQPTPATAAREATPAVGAPAAAATGPAPVAPLFDERGEPTRELVLASLRASVERALPDRKLSSDEYEQLVDAVLRMREARAALSALPVDAEHAERLRALREALATAVADFEYVLEMSPAEFTARADPDGGISAPGEGSEALPEPEFLDDLRAR